MKISEQYKLVWRRPIVPGTVPGKRALFACSLVAGYSFALTSIAVFLVSKGSIYVPRAAVTIAMLIGVSVAAAKYPSHTVRWYAASYLPLKVLATNSLIGYTTPTYTLLAIAVVIFFTKPNTPSPSPRLPGLWAAWLLVAVILAQFSRTTDPGGAFVVLCDASCFTILLAALPKLSPYSNYRMLQYFAFGTLGAAPILWYRASGQRLGESLGLNANELACISGAVLLLYASKMVIPGSKVLVLLIGAVGVIFLAETGSRSAFISFIVCYVLFRLFQARDLKAWFKSVVIVLLFCAAVSTLVLKFGGARVSKRMMSPFTETFDEASGRRAAMWPYLLQQVPNYWIFGAGLQNVMEITEQSGLNKLILHSKNTNETSGLQSHNMYLTAILELGVAGLVAVFCWQTAIIRKGIASARTQPLLLPLFLFFTLNGFFQGLNFDGVLALFMAGSYAAWSVCCRSPRRAIIVAADSRLPLRLRPSSRRVLMVKM